MAYSSAKGRKPIKRASKIAHAQIVNNSTVKALLARCRVPRAPEDGIELDYLRLPEDAPETISAVIAIDGGSTETFVRNEFPSASVTFFNFGPLMLRLEDLRDLDEKDFIFPEDLTKLRRIERFSLAMPTRNVVLDSQGGFVSSFRRTLHEFVENNPAQAIPHWATRSDGLPFADGKPDRNTRGSIPQCPSGCDGPPVRLVADSPAETKCPSCGQPVYTIDILRLHERVDEEQGAGAVTAYLLTTLEQLVMVHVIRSVMSIKKALIGELLFVKDGPLAFFGVVAPLRKPMQELCDYLDGSGGKPLLRVVGVERTGNFVEHALALADTLPPGTVLPLHSDYVYRYIIPGSGTEEYGFNTYYGRKFILRSQLATSTFARCLYEVTGMTRPIFSPSYPSRCP